MRPSSSLQNDEPKYLVQDKRNLPKACAFSLINPVVMFTKMLWCWNKQPRWRSVEGHGAEGSGA